MVTTIQETERKYEGSPIDARLLGNVTGVAAVGEPEHRSLEAMYYDTADLRLARSGITLRRRVGGPDEGWHAKLPAGTEAPDSRAELHLPLSRGAGGSDGVPGELAELVLAYSGGQELRPCANIRTERTAWPLLDERSAVLAEVVEDDVHSQALGDSVTADNWHELEVELVDGDPALLDRIGRKLAKLGVKRSARPSKLVRALGSRLPDGTHSPVSRRSDAGTAVVGYLHEQLAAWRAADVQVRQGGPEGVHDLRVAVRRVRSALKAYRELFREQATRPLAQDLKWLSDLLGDARDLEVVTDGLDRAVHATPLELVLGPVPAELTRHFAARQAGSREAVLTALRGERYLGLLSAVDAFVTDPPLTGAAAVPARTMLPAAVRRSFRRTVRAAAKAERAKPGPERDTALHGVRRAAKRTRYAAEVAEPVVGKDARRLRKRLKAAQGELGDQHDTVLAREALRELATAAHSNGTSAFTFGLLYGQAEEAAGAHERRFIEMWPKVTKRRVTRWLAKR